MRRLALLLLAAALAGCGGNETAAPETQSADGIEDIENVLDLRAAFEADRGKARVLLVFSPT